MCNLWTCNVLLHIMYLSFGFHKTFYVNHNIYDNIPIIFLCYENNRILYYLIRKLIDINIISLYIFSTIQN